MVPIMLVCGLLALQALVAGANHVSADAAAHAAMVASLAGHDATRAARDAVPGWSRGRVRVVASERSIDVNLRPRAFIPQLSPLLEVHSRVRFVSGDRR